MRKLLCLTISILMLLSAPFTVLATSENSISEVESSNSGPITYGPPPTEFKTELGPIKYYTVSDWAAGQPSGGVCFPTGGAFYYTDSSSIQSTGSINFGANWGVFSFGVSIGKVSSGVTAYSYNVAPSNNNYKLWITKKYEVQAYKNYQRVLPNGTWQLYAQGAKILKASVTGTPKKVQ